MKQDEIIEMAEGCGWNKGNAWDDCICCSPFNIEAFAKLVAQHEREACAKACDDRVIAYKYATDVWAQEHIDEARHLAKAIRARGQA